MAFGQEIKRIREVSEVSASKLAELIGIDVDRLRKWEQRNTDPRELDKIKIETFFGQSLEEIAQLEKIPKKLLDKLPFADENYFEKGKGRHISNFVNQIRNENYQINPLLSSKRTKSNKPVKYFDSDFAAGNVSFYEDNVEAPAYEMNIPAFSGCIAFNVFGDSMESLIKSGSVVFGRKIEDWKTYIEYGQIYGIVMKDDRRFLKYIRKCNDLNLFTLKSENSNYDEFEIPKSKIHNIWLIEGWMLKRS